MTMSNLTNEFKEGNMRQTSRMILCGVLAAGLAMSSVTGAFAATEHFSDATTDQSWSGWTQQWETSVSTNYEQVSLTPGRNQSELNFGWYSNTGAAATPVVKLAAKEDMSDAKSFQGTAGSAIDGYRSNKVTVTGLKENTAYYYTYLTNGVESKPAKYTTKSFSSFKMLFFGDPQIGASKGQTVSTGDKLENTSSLNTAARNDAFNWNTTLNVALKANPDTSFALSAGDQINKNVNGIDPGNEIEYAGYLSPAALKSLPVSTTIGNHDATNKSYAFHFNNPNSFTAETSPSAAGNGYYYTYGNALFVVLNTNNYNCADHEALLKKATQENPNTRWRIVMFHQDIYGSGADHSESDGMVLRTQLTPILDKYDVDVVLQGHDHSYSRSYLLQGDGKVHAAYDANKTSTGEFDWDNVVDKATGKVYPYYPKADDAAGKAANAAFIQGNNCYTINNNKSAKVVNPQGTLYMTANSATGSKFYELISQQQNFVAYRNQNWKPSYSVISINDKDFSISTYSIVDGNTSQIDSTFTIEKTVNRTPAAASNSNTGTKGQAPLTGDTNDLTGMIALAALALLGLVTAVIAALKDKRVKAVK